MGTDIHGVIQVPIGGTWANTLSLDFIPRDYHMFGVLAGVRGLQEAMVDVKGLPPKWECWHDEDCSGNVCPLAPDSHTVTWLSTQELEVVFDRIEPKPPYRAILAAMRALGEPVRLVIWFDN